MLELLSPALEAYVVAHTDRESALLQRLREETRRTLPSPQMQVGAVEGALLAMLVRISGARRILELGTFSGYSSLCMAAALPEGGHILTCDIDPVATGVARRYFDESGLGDRIEIRLGPALDTLGELARAGDQLDLVFIDADKELYPAYWDAAVPLVRPGGLVVADNVLWSGQVLGPREASDHGIVAFNAKAAADARVDRVLLSVRDGILVARKR
jgi:caffeoyl-CoA O-methyltransferase